MKSLQNRLRGIFIGIVLVFLPAFPVLADDTEVFLGATTIETGVRPNVLFILDNSGSMQNAPQRGGTPKIDSLKEAFSTLMSTVTGINAGVMRFNNPGGSILYPVTNIDTVLSTESYGTHMGLNESGDDAVEDIDTGNVYVDETDISITSVSDRTTIATLSIPIADEKYNITEFPTLGDGGSNFYGTIDNPYDSAYKFDLSSLPEKSTIFSATITYTAFDSSGDVFTRFYGEKTLNPEDFDTSNPDTINNRLNNKTNASIDWGIRDGRRGRNNWVSGTQYETPDLALVVQEIVDQTDWYTSDKSIVLISSPYYGSGYRDYIHYQNGNSWTHDKAPVLTISYSAAGTAEQMAGFRFQNVDVPKGATITDAHIEFTNREAVDPSGLQYTVTMENSGDSAAFTSTNGDLSSRTKHAGVVTWQPDSSWSDAPPPDADAAVVTGPDVTSLVQYHVNNQANWCGNNSMAFFFTKDHSESKTLKVFSFDEGSGKEAVLKVSYDYDPDNPPAIPNAGCIQENFQTAINQSENDAHEDTSWRWNSYPSANELSSDKLVGLRFENIPVAQGATVLEAYLEYVPNNSTNYPAAFSITGEAVDNANAFNGSRSNIRDRDRTTATVTWEPEEWNTDERVRSNDISNIVEEIVSRAGWQPGNALALIVSGNQSGTNAYSYDGDPARAPKLVLKLEDGGIEFKTNTVRSHLVSLVNDLEAKTWTPIVDSLYEASLYFRGDQVDYGLKRVSGDLSARDKRISSELSLSSGSRVDPGNDCPLDGNLSSNACVDEYLSSGSTYKSPIISECQNNYIVLLTDGAANQNHSASKIKTLTGSSGCSPTNSDEECAYTLSRFMNVNDQSSSVTGTNSVKTYTIAFDLTESGPVNFLKNLASVGGGEFKSASSATELASAFQEIVNEIISIDATFVSPGATVNQFNRLTHREDIYFSLFRPLKKPKWPGNVKKYQLNGNPVAIRDADGITAVDPDTGFFKPTSRSFWGSTDDGSIVDQGGAANQIPAVASRKVYTYLPGASGASTTLSNSVNALSESNTNITSAMLGAADLAERNNILKWARGVDVNDWDEDGDTSEVRHQLGDPLHSVPLLVTYGGTVDNQDTTLFVGTNEGYLHAIDTDTGEEVFSFVPKELLGNLKLFYDDSSLLSSSRYGLDGSPVAWIYDANFNNQIESGDHVYLYIGMRRGGRNLYALDVTSRTSPKILWTIEGGTGDFAELGQTWSKPQRTRIKINDTIKDVLIFAGGYDTSDDSITKRVDSASTMGNAIYMIDAKTGDLLWKASETVNASDGLSLSDMTYAIPSDVNVIDLDLDGLADHLFVGDMGGQVWRFDIHQGNSASSLVSGGVIADFAGDTAADFRPFFYPPSVALFQVGGAVKFGISLGSGLRPHPVSDMTVNNRFYTFFNDLTLSSYTKVTETDLTDRTLLDTNVIENNGWYIRLTNTGEKVLANPLILNNQIFFTTFEPASTTTNCSASAGTARLYIVNALNGNATVDLNDSDSLDAIDDRSQGLATGSIPPSPKVFFTDAGSPTLIIGTEKLDDAKFNLGNIPTNTWFKSYWREDFSGKGDFQ